MREGVDVDVYETVAVDVFEVVIVGVKLGVKVEMPELVGEAVKVAINVGV